MIDTFGINFVTNHCIAVCLSWLQAGGGSCDDCRRCQDAEHEGGHDYARCLKRVKELGLVLFCAGVDGARIGFLLG